MESQEPVPRPPHECADYTRTQQLAKQLGIVALAIQIALLVALTAGRVTAAIIAGAVVELVAVAVAVFNNHPLAVRHCSDHQNALDQIAHCHECYARSLCEIENKRKEKKIEKKIELKIEKKI